MLRHNIFVNVNVGVSDEEQVRVNNERRTSDKTSVSHDNPPPEIALLLPPHRQLCRVRFTVIKIEERWALWLVSKAGTPGVQVSRCPGVQRPAERQMGQHQHTTSDAGMGEDYDYRQEGEHELGDGEMHCKMGQ